MTRAALVGAGFAAPCLGQPAVAPPGAGSHPTATPAFRQANHVAVITIEGVVDHMTLRSLERRVKHALDDGADALALDLDTPGGEVGATFDICHVIRNDAPRNTVAWINPQAFSAGTIIALACREIVVAPNSTFGDAAPIRINSMPFVGGLEPLPPDERAKIEAPLLDHVVGSAHRNHYDENLVQAFVSMGVELWMLEHISTGERAFVDRAEYRAVFGDEPPQQFTAVTPARPSDPDAVRVRHGSAVPPAEQPGDDAVLDEAFRQARPRVRPLLTAADAGQWRLLAQVDAADRLLTLDQDEAVFYGMASQVIRTDAELKAFFGAQQLTRYDVLWSESLVRFLTSLPVMAVLLAVFLVALFLELAAPGVGVFGMTALVALAVLLGAPALAGMAQWWEVLLVIVGMVLVAVELFLVPGLGLPGILGALCLLVGLVGAFVSGDLSTSQGQGELYGGLIATFAAILGAGLAIWLISRNLPGIPLLERIMLKASLPSGGGTGAESRAPIGLLEAMGRPQRALQEGDLGVAETDLRPSGRAGFGGRIVDVQTAGSYVTRGSPVRVVSVGRLVIEVEEASA